LPGNYKIYIDKDAQKDKEKIKQYPALVERVDMLVEVLRSNPYQNPPEYKKLKGDLEGLYSRRINIQHRLIYQVDDENKRVKILAMWTHYE